MKKRSLVFELTTYFLVSISILLLVVGWLNYDVSSKIIMHDTEKKTSESVKRTVDYINSYTNKLKMTANSISKNNTIYEFITSNSSTRREKSNELIKTIINTDENLVSAVIITKDGRVISNESHLEMKMSDNMMEEKWYKLAIQKNSIPVLTSARKEDLTSDKESWVISVTQEIVDNQGNNLGVVRLDVDYRAIESYLNKLDLGKYGYAFIIDEQGQVVYHPDKNVFTDTELRNKMLKLSNNKDGYMDKESLFVRHYFIEDLGWNITAVASLDELNTVKRTLINSFSLIAILAIIVASMGVFFIIKRCVRPIKDLREVMIEIEKGNQNIRAKETGSIEIEELSKKFNLMLDKISQLMKDVREKEQDIREYELKALASQINPHFLYNTLDTIIWMAEFNDSESVVEITKSLAKYFRLSLNQGNEMISLSDEIDHVRQYLFIQKKRYGKKLNYHIEEIDECKDFIIPKLILQPVVENSIYHGIKEIERDGFIKIKVENVVDYIKVSIEDNGKGMPVKMKKDEMTNRLGGVGLKNVNRRLSLYFGKNYKMDVDSEPDKYTKVVFYMPKKCDLDIAKNMMI
ncbi:histidine kinase [Peptostreptococcus canis]|uniref:Sensor histidine kinase n=1 Tax=Peptostreptococcus canis TaxID=1159213 RepID=A0ABR6TLQ7_9FIRM|nr:sensor histidine kinase [Peptostreptococcus canis]MBP1998541.1 two-component system sensor histidine kinase YesM [Peptostreptococcus canis]